MAREKATAKSASKVTANSSKKLETAKKTAAANSKVKAKPESKVKKATKQTTKKPAAKSTAKATATRNAAPRMTAGASKKAETASKTSKSAAAKKPSTKAGTKKAAPSKLTNGDVAMNTSRKRKTEPDTDEIDAKSASTANKKRRTGNEGKTQATKKTTTRKTKAAEPEQPRIVKGPVISEPPTERLDVLVFGEGSAGELGLGTAKNAVDVKRPRLNPNLLADKVGVTQLVAGGMHALAITSDNQILSWGVNDSSALGRDTAWEGGLRDADKEESDDDSDDEDSGLNPLESNPTAVDFSTTSLAEGTRWVQVAAGDSCSFAVTDDGKVYGWGEFRANDGAMGFTPDVKQATRPILIEGLKNVVEVSCGANHAIARDNKGKVFAWGSGQQSQLGRRVVERNKNQALYPREVGLPRGVKGNVTAIASGQYHSFAIDKKGEVYAWGLNSFGETGIVSDTSGEDDAHITPAQRVTALQGKNIVSISGGGHHSVAADADGNTLTWGRIESGQCGIAKSDWEKLGDNIQRNERGQLALLSVPTKCEAVKGKAIRVAAGVENSYVITEEGQAYVCGFSENYQTGLNVTDDVDEFTLVDNTASRERKIVGAAAGGQFAIFTAVGRTGNAQKEERTPPESALKN